MTSEASTDLAPEAPSLSKRSAWLLLLLPLCLFLWTGQRSLDYGEHWDEAFQVQMVQHSVEQETLLPGWYNYPSVSYWLSFAALTPELLEADWSGVGTHGPLAVGAPIKGSAAAQAQLLEATRTPGFLLRMRMLFLCVSALSILGVFCAVRKTAGNWEALFAASLIATSFELAYHSRWVAPDAVLTGVVALSLAALLKIYRSGGSLVCLGLLAGIATGTKYTAGLLLLPILFVWWHTSTERQPRRLLVGLASFLGAFLVTTPGALLQPVRFWRDVAFERFHYGEAGHYGFTVEPGWEHLSLSLRWLSSDLGSHYTPLALFITFLALVGAVSSWRRDRTEAVLILIFPLAWLLFFSTQKVLFVRNLLPLAPCFALLSARGLSYISSSMPGRAKAIPLALGAGLLLANATWLYTASGSIIRKNQGEDSSTSELLSWLATGRDERSVFLSEALARELYGELNQSLPPGCTADPNEETELAAFRPSEVALGAFPGDPTGTLRSNLPGCMVTSFGPKEVNWEWYTTWREPRIVVIERAFLEPLQRSQDKKD
jgi:4-amino-4-deoxy-L-arabinose transferase-like glycosyltransferase